MPSLTLLFGAADESAQVQYVVDRVLEHREAGAVPPITALRRDVELGR